MSTVSITHHPIPVATAAAAALAVLAFGVVVVAQDHQSTAPTQHPTNVDQLRKHAGRLNGTTSGGQTMIGLP